MHRPSCRTYPRCPTCPKSRRHRLPHHSWGLHLSKRLGRERKVLRPKESSSEGQHEAKCGRTYGARLRRNVRQGNPRRWLAGAHTDRGRAPAHDARHSIRLRAVSLAVASHLDIDGAAILRAFVRFQSHHPTTRPWYATCDPSGAREDRTHDPQAHEPPTTPAAWRHGTRPRVHRPFAHFGDRDGRPRSRRRRADPQNACRELAGRACTRHARDCSARGASHASTRPSRPRGSAGLDHHHPPSRREQAQPQRRLAGRRTYAAGRRRRRACLASRLVQPGQARSGGMASAGRRAKRRRAWAERKRGRTRHRAEFIRGNACCALAQLGGQRANVRPTWQLGPKRSLGRTRNDDATHARKDATPRRRTYGCCDS